MYWVLAWFASIAAIAAGTWGKTGTPGEDVAMYFYQVERSLDTGEILWRGYFSQGGTHPGPILHHILWLGGKTADLLGFDRPSGYVAIYLAVIAGLVVLSLRTVARAVGGCAAAGVLACTWFMQEWYLARAGGGLVSGMTSMAIYGPNLSAFLTLAGIAAGIGIMVGLRSSSLWAIVIGGWLIQINTAVVPAGVALLLVGTCAWWRGGKTWRRGGLILGWGMGAGALLGRWIMEGWSFPLEYSKNLYRVAENIASRDEMTFWELSSGALAEIPPAVVSVGVIVGLLGYVLLGNMQGRPHDNSMEGLRGEQTPTKTRGAKIAIWLTFITAWQLSFMLIIGGKTHHFTPLGAYMAIIGGGGLGALVGAATKTIKWRRVGAAVRIVGIVAVVIYAAVGSLTGHARAYPREAIVPTEAYQTLVETVGQDKTEMLGVIVASTDMDEHRGMNDVRRSEMYLALEYAEVPYCSGSIQTGAEQIKAPTCSGRNPKRWLVVAREPEFVDQGTIMTYQVEGRETFYVHLTDNLETYGFRRGEDNANWVYTGVRGG